MTSQAFSPEVLVTARMLELVDARTPWHRSLWRIGTTLQLREVLEYADGVRTGATNNVGLEYVLKVCSADVRRDVGLGTEATVDQIKAILDAGSKKSAGVLEPHVARSLEQFIHRAEDGYLSRWRTWVADGNLTADHVELLSRSLAAHLLDAGFSNDHLHQWLRAKNGRALTLPALIKDAERMLGRPYVDYEVVVPVERCPADVSSAAGTRFLSADALDEKVRDLGVDPASDRQGAGALIFQVSARDPMAAIDLVEIEVRRLAARVVVGLSSERVQASSKALVTNMSRPRWLTIKSRQRDILVSSIVRNELLLPSSRNSASTSPTSRALDDAFELLAAVETSTSWASVAAIWAAVEGLLSGPNERGVEAADRMAAVVTTGFVRAELTQLVRHLENDADPRTAVSLDRLDTLLDRIASNEDLGIADPADAAAVARIEAILADPAAVLGRVRGYFADSFRRLFQQRNNLLHGGRFDSDSLPGTMRTVPPLVAAGVDRLVHGSLSPIPTAPLSLAARAENELALLGSDGARPIHRMLD